MWVTQFNPQCLLSLQKLLYHTSQCQQPARVGVWMPEAQLYVCLKASELSWLNPGSIQVNSGSAQSVFCAVPRMAARFAYRAPAGMNTWSHSCLASAAVATEIPRGENRQAHCCTNKSAQSGLIHLPDLHQCLPDVMTAWTLLIGHSPLTGLSGTSQTHCGFFFFFSFLYTQELHSASQYLAWFHLIIEWVNRIWPT